MEKIGALEDAIAKKSLVGIYSVFYTIAHGDPDFSTGKFREALRYVKNQNIEGFIQEFDGEEFEPEDNWDEDYWALVASSLMDNFCEERIGHLEEIGKKVYPYKEKMHVKTEPLERTLTQTGQGMSGRGRAEKRMPVNTGRKEGLISEEQKRKVKSAHVEKTDRNGGGLLKRLFGRESGR